MLTKARADASNGFPISRSFSCNLLKSGMQRSGVDVRFGLQCSPHTEADLA